MAKKNELKHLAVILDGNGRWAEQHGLERVKGHKAGADRVNDLIRNLEGTGVKYLTLYAFSNENWSRSEEEVSALMGLLCDFLDEYRESMKKDKIRLLFSGRRSRMPAECLERLDRVMEETKTDEPALTLILALNYGGRQEITDAVRNIAEKVLSGTVKPEEIDENMIAENLYYPFVPDPDLLIRTSGELRISNFLLWQASYSEFYFTDTLWPDFDKEELMKAIDSYYNRNRRFGGRK